MQTKMAFKRQKNLNYTQNTFQFSRCVCKIASPVLCSSLRANVSPNHGGLLLRVWCRGFVEFSSARFANTVSQRKGEIIIIWLQKKLMGTLLIRSDLSGWHVPSLPAVSKEGHKIFDGLFP